MDVNSLIDKKIFSRKEFDMKKLLSILLTLILAISCTNNVYAAEMSEEIIWSESELAEYNDLCSDGLTQTEASQILQIERIVAKLEENNLYIDNVNGECQIFDSNGNIVSEKYNNLTVNEMAYIIDILENYQATETNMTYETAMTEVEHVMTENPGQDRYRISFENGTWIEARRDFSTSNVEVNTMNIDDTLLPLAEGDPFDNAKYPSEVEDVEARKVVGLFGNEAFDYEIAYWGGAYYTITRVAVTANFTTEGVTIINSPRSPDCHGVMSIDNEYNGVVIEECTSTNPTLWAEAVSWARYTVSSSINPTLLVGKFFDFTVEMNDTWTQYVIIRVNNAGFRAYVGHSYYNYN